MAGGLGDFGRVRIHGGLAEPEDAPNMPAANWGPQEGEATPPEQSLPLHHPLHPLQFKASRLKFSGMDDDELARRHHTVNNIRAVANLMSPGGWAHILPVAFGLHQARDTQYSSELQNRERDSRAIARIEAQEELRRKRGQA